MLFRYEAMDRAGQRHAGTTEAGSVAEARAALRNRGLLSYRLEGAGGQAAREGAPKEGGVSWLSLSGRKLSLLTEATRHLAILLRTGLPLAKALEVLSAQMRDRHFRTVLEDLACRIREGTAIDEALSAYPAYFPQLYIHLVRSGVHAGELPKILAELASYYTRQKRLRDRVVSALTYPILMCGVGALVLTFLMTFVVPKVTALLLEQGRVLPWPTEVLLFASNLAVKRWWLLLGLLLGGGYLLRTVLRTRKGRRAWDAMVLRIPVIGDLYRKQAVAHWAATMSTLLSSGLPVAESLSIVRGAATSAALEEDVERLEREVVEGRNLSDAAKRSRILPPAIGFVVGIGEESGELDQVLREVADGYNEEVDLMAGRIADLVNPILIIFLGLVVGFIVAAILLPITDFSKKP